MSKTTLIPALAFAALIASDAEAHDIRLDGQVAQGGLVTGYAKPGCRVSLDGRAVRVGADGLFVFGFGRDAGPQATLQTICPGGGAHRLAVAKRKFDIQRIDGLPQAMVTPDEQQLARIKVEQEQINETRRRDDDRPDFAAGFMWPATGPISGVYGSQRILNGEPRAAHYGVDVAMPTGTPVLAAAGGVVVLAENDLYFTGGTIILDHGYGVTTTYQHLSALSVAKGRRVERGQKIGAIGATGRVTGPHLHWSVNWFEVRIDPQLTLGPMPKPEAAGR